MTRTRRILIGVITILMLAISLWLISIALWMQWSCRGLGGIELDRCLSPHYYQYIEGGQTYEQW